MRFAIFLAAVAIGSVPGCATPGGFVAELNSGDVNALIQDVERTRTEPLVTRITDDAVLQLRTGEEYVGAQEVREQLESGRVTAGYPVVASSISDIAICSNALVQTGTYFASPGDNPDGLFGKFVAMWRMEQGEWRIFRIVLNPLRLRVDDYDGGCNSPEDYLELQRKTSITYYAPYLVSESPAPTQQTARSMVDAGWRPTHTIRNSSVRRPGADEAVGGLGSLMFSSRLWGPLGGAILFSPARYARNSAVWYPDSLQAPHVITLTQTTTILSPMAMYEARYGRVTAGPGVALTRHQWTGDYEAAQEPSYVVALGGIAGASVIFPLPGPLFATLTGEYRLLREAEITSYRSFVGNTSLSGSRIEFGVAARF
jgi:hypothetical protein